MDASLAGYVLEALVLIVSSMVLLAVGKAVFAMTNRRFNLREELVERDNPAMGLVVAGYLLGLALAIGGALSGPSRSLERSLIDLVQYGAAGIVLLHLSAWINDKVILSRFDNIKEIVEDRNCGTGAVVAANHVAVGLIVYGSMLGQGTLLTALAFWGMGQVALIIMALIYRAITPYDVHEQIEKDNVAVGVAFAGVLVATANVVRFAIQGDFISWKQDLIFFATVIVIGAIMLPVARFVTGKIILTGASLTHELANQAKPNLGVGFIEASVYVAASFIIGWCLA